MVNDIGVRQDAYSDAVGAGICVGQNGRVGLSRMLLSKGGTEPGNTWNWQLDICNNRPVVRQVDLVVESVG